MNLIVSSIESERETIVREAVDLFLNLSSKLPDPVVVLSDGKFSMDKRFKILCPFIGDLLSLALDEPPTIIIPDFHSRTFDCIGSILIQGYGKYYSHDVKEVVELGRALNIGGINSVSVSKVGDGKDSEEASILTDNETKNNEIVAKLKLNMPESKASEMKKDLNKLSVEKLIEGNIILGVNEYHEDNNVEPKVEIESKANIGDINKALVGKVADGEDVHGNCEEGEIVSDEEETKEKEIVSRIKMAEFSKIFRDVPNIASKNEESFKCKDCIKSFSSQIALNIHFKAKHSSSKCKICSKSFSSLFALKYHFTDKHSSHASNLTTNYEENLPFPCFYCNGSFLNKSSLNSHKFEKHCTKKQITITCTYCSRTFKTKQSLNSHIISKHTEMISKKS